MESYSDTQAIFRQLAQCESAGAVRSVIENHDAWVHGEEAGWALVGVVMSPMVERRVQRQRRRLAGLVTVLPVRVASAG